MMDIDVDVDVDIDIDHVHTDAGVARLVWVILRHVACASCE